MQLVSLSLMPVVTRIYSPEELGIYQFITSTALIVSPFVTLSLTYAMISVDRDNEFFSIARASIVLANLMSIFFSIMFLFFIIFFSTLDGLDVQHALYMYFVLISGGLYLIFSTLNIRNKNYIRFSIQGVILSLSGNLSKVGIGSVKPVSESLILGTIFGNFLAIAYSIKFWPLQRINFSTLISSSSITHYALKYKDFSFHLTLSNVISIFLGWHIIFIAPFLGTAKDVGLLALAIMAVRTPSYPFLMTISNYAFNEVARAREEGVNYSIFLVKIGVIGLVLSLSIFFVLYFFGGQLFSIVFGREWVKSEDFALIISFPLISAFALSPIYKAIANIFSFQKALLIADVFFLLIISVVCYFSAILDVDLLSFLRISCFILFALHFVKLIIVGVPFFRDADMT